VTDITKTRSMFHRPTKTHSDRRRTRLSKPKIDCDPVDDILDKLVVTTTLLRKTVEVMDTDECRDLIREIREVLENDTRENEHDNGTDQ